MTLAQVGVAAALAIAVHAALYVGGARFDRGHGVGRRPDRHRCGRVMPMTPSKRRADFGDAFRPARPVSVPPLVSQRQSTSAPA